MTDNISKVELAKACLDLSLWEIRWLQTVWKWGYSKFLKSCNGDIINIAELN